MTRLIQASPAILLALLSVGCPSSGVPEPPQIQPVDDSEPLEELIDRTLAENLSNRLLTTELNGAWQILHGVLAYGDSLQIRTSDGSANAVQHLLSGGRVNGFEPVPGDLLGEPRRRGMKMELQPTTKVGQGHRDQWLAVLAQTGLSEDAEIRTAADEFTIADWLRQTEYDIPLNLESEFSWTLIGLTAYRSTDHHWTSRDGRRYNVESLVGSEVAQSLPTSACGGTHRLIGLAMALNKRREEGAPVTGVWAEADSVVNQAIRQAKRNQNPDGSYSLDYIHRPGWTRDLGENLGTTGHVLEFLALAAPEETLREAWVERTVRRLCAILEQLSDVDLECGVLYHALHGLQEYRNRLS